MDERIYRWTVDISDGSWTDPSAQENMDALPVGIQLRPSMLDQVIDLSEHHDANPLADAYLAITSANPSEITILARHLP